MRYSTQREAILAYVKGSLEHPTADMVYEAVKKDIPSISLGTVYRNLSQLVSEHEIIELDAADKKAHYDGNTDGHLHFLCKSCGTIIDLDYRPEPPEELTRLGHRVLSGTTVYYGICSQCLNRAIRP